MTELVVCSLLTADKVIKEDNGKHSAIGIFDRFLVANFPATLPPWGIYVSLRNLSKGDHTFAVNLVHDETSSAVLGLSGDITAREPGSGIEMGIPVLSTTLPGGGSYTMSLHIDGEHVATRILAITQVGNGVDRAAADFSVDDDDLTDEEVLEMRDAGVSYRSGEAELIPHENLARELAGD